MVHKKKKKKLFKNVDVWLYHERGSQQSFETLVIGGSPCCHIEDTSLLGQYPRSPVLGTATGCKA